MAKVHSLKLLSLISGRLVRNTLVLGFCLHSAATSALGQVGGSNGTRFSPEIAIPLTSANQSKRYVVSINDRSSYCCEALGAGLTASFSNFTKQSQSDFTPIALPTKSRADFAGGDRRCFSVENSFGRTGPGGYVTVGFDLTIGDLTQTKGAFMRCQETTLFVGYNTNVTDFNFLEVVNQSPTTGSLQDLDGGLNDIAAKIGTDEYVFPESRRTDIDIHSKVGPGVFGQIRIQHDGAPGALSCAISQYNITSQTPLDFEPVAREECRTRSGK